MTFRFLACALLCTSLGIRMAAAREIKSFAFYYGTGKVAELSRYDLVVLQPHQYTAGEIAQLKKAGALVLGYISLGEDATLRRDNGKGPGGYAPWYIDQFEGPGFARIGADNVPDKNADWNSLYVDPSHPRWKKSIRQNIERMRTKLNLDGVFADTVSIPPDVFTIATEQRMKKGMTYLVSKLKPWSGGGFVLVNNGYAPLEQWAPRIDGLILEASYNSSTDFLDMLKHITDGAQPARSRYDLFIGGLFYLPAQEDASRACEVLKNVGFPSILYSSDEAGRTLKALPHIVCP